MEHKKGLSIAIVTQNGQRKIMIQTAFKAQCNNISKNLINLHIPRGWARGEGNRRP